VELMKRCGLRYTCPDASRDELERALLTLKTFKDQTGLFYSIVDEVEITPTFVKETLEILG